VAIAALDPRSLRAFPEWPCPRGLHADLLRRLDSAGAAVIAFDIDFSTPRDPAQDGAFAAAVADSGRVVLAAFRQLQTLPEGGDVEIANLPIPDIAAGAAAVGSVLMPVDSDGVVRSAPRSNLIAGRSTPSLAAAALAVALRDAAPHEPEGQIPLDYRRSRPPVPVLSVADLIEGRFDPRDVAGRVVMIGATAAEFQDLWSTPLAPAQPGVWIQAMAYRTLAAERAGEPILVRASPAFELTHAAVLSLLAATLGGVSHRRRLAAIGALGVAVPSCGFALLVTRGLLLDPLVPLGVLGAHYVLGLERVRQRFRRRLHERELSLSALFRVGEAAGGGTTSGGLDVALALLGDVVDASGVAFLRASPDGRLDGRRIDWQRKHTGSIGDPEAAASVLEARALRVREAGAGLIVYAPPFAAETPVGVLVVERDGSEPLDETQLRTIATVGTQLALSAENLRLIDDLRSTFDSSVEAIASAIEARDGYTESHCRRLALFSTLMADRLGLPAAEIEGIRLGALLHDVGKIGVRDEILLKPGRFSAQEMAEMKQHADIGHRIIGGIAGISEATRACVRHHHERWDGSGYPDGLAGEGIPIGARIVTVVDVWDALSTARPYKPAYPQSLVRTVLRKGRGDEFDPALVDLFLRILDEEGDELLALLDVAPPERA
jgi:HD-GYP domain-containing protein (c-di-GMP phosphodiesterase class II)/CHASE2 domain-containing sensor protein